MTDQPPPPTDGPPGSVVPTPQPLPTDPATRPVLHSQPSPQPSPPPASTAVTSEPDAASPEIEPTLAPLQTEQPADADLVTAIRAEVAKVIVGQQDVLTSFLAALLADGHVLLEGVPGVAKTLLVKTIAATLSIEMSRIQFTPDLMPSDVTGQLMYQQDSGKFTFRAGPVFTNLLLADEINRTPPKTQAALLEVMEERQVTIAGTARPLPTPFMVIATQNPVEYEGTYPLPEAQLDRFLAKIRVDYPDRDAEQEVLRRHHEGFDLHKVAANGVQAIADATDLAAAREQVRGVNVDTLILAYITEIVRATRVSPVVDLGVSPRGGVAMLGLAKAWAWMSGRDFVTPDDIKVVTKPALRHRLQVQAEAELEGVTPDIVIDGLLSTVPVPR